MKVMPFGGVTSASRIDWPISSALTSTVIVSTRSAGQRLDVHLVGRLAERAAHVHALGVPLEVHGDRRVDLLVEPDLVQVDVDRRGRGRGRAGDSLISTGRGLLAVDADVEDGVQPAARKRMAQVARVQDDRLGLGGRRIDHAGDVAGGAQRLGVLRPAPLAHARLISLAPAPHHCRFVGTSGSRRAGSRRGTAPRRSRR